jgi:hypothetical protein
VAVADEGLEIMSRGERCPGCGAPRLPMAYCPQCQTVYEPAATAAKGPAGAKPGAVWRGDEHDARLELKLRAIAPLVALGLAWLAYTSSFGQSFFRTFLSMWLHEFGHAVTAWLCGFSALPGPWRTSVADERSIVLSLLLFGALAALGYKAWRARRFGVVAGAAVVVLLQIIGTFGLHAARARALITFGGDGGGLVLGTLLFLTFYSRPGSYVHEHWLRWGFLVIGAFGYVDPMVQWWRANHDADTIPYGEMEGVGTSDPTRLIDDYGWSEKQLVGRYVMLGTICLVVIVVAYVYGLFAEWRRTVRARADAAAAR